MSKNILLVSNSDRPALYSLTRPSLLEYCNKNKNIVVEFNDNIDTSRHPSWKCIKLLI